jgi:hypothetical protein
MRFAVQRERTDTTCQVEAVMKRDAAVRAMDDCDEGRWVWT